MARVQGDGLAASGAQGVGLAALFAQAFGASRVQPGEACVVLTDRSRTADGYVEAACDALQGLGAEPLTVTLPPSSVVALPGETARDALAATPPAVALLAQADFVVDLTSHGIIHSAARREVQAAGTRILTVLEPPEVLARMPPAPRLREAARRAAARLDAARELHVTSAAGTDLRVRLGEHPAAMQYGAADEPGRWDHWPGTLVVRYPDDGTAEGVIVLDVGDILLPMNRYVAEPVRCVVEAGRLVAIEGRGLDAAILRDYLAIWDDPEVYATSHVGWGLDPRAQWVALATMAGRSTIGMDARAFRGNFMWSTGPNHFVGRETPCHLDIPMRGCTVALDGEIVVDAGRVVDAI